MRKYVRKLKSEEEKKKILQPKSQMDYEDELYEYSKLQLSSEMQAGSSTSKSFPPSSSVIKIDDDSEIEDGEIVERDVDLIEESFSALSQSRKIKDLSPLKKPIFYEDKNADDGFKPTPIPIYNTIESSNDVICLDNSSPELDDSVVFVSRYESLQKPPALLSQNINQLITLSNTPTSNQKKILSPNRIKKLERTRKYREKKALEKKAKLSEPSTSTPIIVKSLKEKAKVLQEAEKVKTLQGTKKAEKQKRLILIDGSNVAISHAKALQGKKYDENSKFAFSVEGLKVAVNHFEKMGFEVRAIIPEYRLKYDRNSNANMIKEMQENGSLICTASRAYDDRILLESATRLNAAIVSNDFFRDFKSNESFYEVISKRQIRFNWVFSEFILTDDPYGKFGPKLQDILYYD